MNRLLALLVLLPSFAWAQETSTPSSDSTHFGSRCTYPESARRTHSEGSTFVSFRGTDDGHVVDVAVIQSSGNSDLDDATVLCVSRWRFDQGVPADQTNIGTHRAGIAWSAGVQPAGTFIGVPHSCAWYYPKAEEKAGVEGTTRLSFTITSDGNVRDPVVGSSSGSANLDDAALKCVRHWQYRPALKDGKSMAVPWKADVVWKVEVAQAPLLAAPARDCLRTYPVRESDLVGIEGTTEVTFNIVGGEVHKTSVTHSSGSAALDRVAVDCIASRRYVRETVLINGKAVDKYQSMTLRERIAWADALKLGK